MNNNNLSYSNLIFISSITFILGTLLSFLMFILLLLNPLKGEAVEKGYAEWKVVDNNTGETKFVWK